MRQMTNDVHTDSALQAVNFCCVIFNFAFQAVPDSAKFVVAFGCCCHSISSGGEISTWGKKWISIRLVVGHSLLRSLVCYDEGYQSFDDCFDSLREESG